MKTLFLLAKYYAKNDNSMYIELTHLEKALNNVEIINEEAKSILSDKFDLEKISFEYLTEDYTVQVQNIPTIKYSEDVNILKKELSDKNITLEIIISKLLIKENLIEESIITKKSSTKSIQTEFSKIKALKEELNKKVFSQELAVESICDKLSESIYLKNEKMPKAIFFFLGPPATGKTYITELIAENLKGYAYTIFDMGNYKDEGQGFALFGLSKGFKSSEDGKLTRFVKENPKSVVVFDEVEKAHPKVLQSFLPLLSQGKVKDEYSQEMIDFNETILIFTSNLGSELYSNKVFLEKIKGDKENAQTMLLDVIARETTVNEGREMKVLSPEFLSRISQGDIVLFNKLTFDSYLAIAQSILEKNINLFKNKLELNIEYGSLEKLATILLLTFLPDFDARRIKSKISLKIFDPITDKIRDEDISNIKNIKFIFDKKVEKFIESFSQKNSDEKNDFINEHFRKTFTYKFNLENELNSDKELVFTIKDLIQVRIDKSKDFKGEGKINLEIPTISFSDIAGHKKAKEDLNQIKELLINPKKLDAFKIDMPKGMLLYGIPGTGKTMLAKAFANEADLPFISTTGSEILDLDFMKKIFKRAREYAPSIIFIDEIDAIGKRTGGSIDIIINHFLTELNGFGDSKDNIFVIAATNIKEKIDPAILRSGRIDQHIEIGNLDKEAREYFINKIIKNHNLININKEKIIIYTSGMTGADLERVNRESSLYLIKHGLEKLTEDILLEKINIIKYGERLKGKFIQELIDGTAYHEAGHAVISKILSPDTKIEQITIVPRNNSLGFVSYNNEDNVSNSTKNDIKNKICTLLAGRLSQMRMYGENAFDSGASSDLAHATSLANLAISKLGMSDKIGYFSIERLQENELSESLKTEIANEIKSWLDEAKEKTIILIDKNWTIIESVAKSLIKNESIEEKELNDIIRSNSVN